MVERRVWIDEIRALQGDDLAISSLSGTLGLSMLVEAARVLLGSGTSVHRVLAAAVAVLQSHLHEDACSFCRGRIRHVAEPALAAGRHTFCTYIPKGMQIAQLNDS